MLYIIDLGIDSDLDISKEHFKVVDFEDTAVTDFATFAGGKYFYIPPTSVKIVSQGDTVSEFEDFRECIVIRFLRYTLFF